MGERRYNEPARACAALRGCDLRRSRRDRGHLCLAIVIGLGRRINSSLRLLERAVGNLRRQKPTVERTGEREIDSVIEAFNLTAGEISAHEQERAAHERQMRVAAREVTHRSKNLLAVTTAIAGLLSRDAPDAKTFSIRFNERLQALSRCQDLLIASNWTEATMEDVIESQLAPFTKEQFDLFGESVKIPAGSMQALCMVFHELATNAARHGALSVANGRVAVNWSIGPEEPDRTVSIVWREIGGPTVRVPGRRGFGGTVIATSCRQSLNGTIDLDFRPEGLVCSFTILLRNPTPEPAFEAGNDSSGRSTRFDDGYRRAHRAGSGSALQCQPRPKSSGRTARHRQVPLTSKTEAQPQADMTTPLRW